MKQTIKDIITNAAKGEIEFIIRDKNGLELYRRSEHNIVKIFAKEMLSHRLPYSKIWNQNADSGAGAWEATNIDADEEFSARYILLGASFDDNGIPLEFNDIRFYTLDTLTSSYTPTQLSPSAEYDGDLINPITLLEPDRPLKRVESIDFESSYQPSGTPLLQDDVRAINNVVVFETVVRTDEYNGFGTSDSDYFTLTEVALAGGRLMNSIGTCNCTPRTLFLEGVSTGSSGSAERALLCGSSGGDVITIDSSEVDVDLIKQGDQIRITTSSAVLDGSTIDSLNQTSPYYLVTGKQVGGRDIQLDRAVVDSNGDSITGNVGVFRDTLRIFSHRVLQTPIRKSSDIELVVRWRIIFN